jgi:predicted nucleic acid-binding protein
MPIVVDNSIVMSWCLADESDPLADRAMQHVTEDGAVVPGIWWYELRNALIVNERRGRLDAADTTGTLTDLREMSIAFDWEHDDSVIVALARRCDLSVYDAAYIEVAQRRGLRMVSLDRRLCQAATTSHVPLFD